MSEKEGTGGGFARGASPVRGPMLGLFAQFLQQLLALELCGFTPDHLHRSLENPSEPLSASTVWGITQTGGPQTGGGPIASRDLEAGCRGPDGQFRPELASGGLSWPRGRLQTTF